MDADFWITVLMSAFVVLITIGLISGIVSLVNRIVGKLYDDD